MHGDEHCEVAFKEVWTGNVYGNMDLLMIVFKTVLTVNC